jgi:hypothetical protein
VVNLNQSRKALTGVFPLVRAYFRAAPSAGFEPAHMAPEANALSPELRGRDDEG